MAIKIVFFDIDGTLISRKTPRLTRETVDALNGLREKGLKLCIASGRHMSEIRDFGISRDFAFDAYVTLNGNYCCDSEGNVIHANELDRGDVLNCLDYVQAHSIPCMFVEGDIFYINFINERVAAVQEFINSPLPMVLDPVRVRQNPIYQLIPYIPAEEAEELFSLMPHSRPMSWHPLAFDVLNTDSGKQYGIRAVLEYFGLSREETMAIGDGDNDIEMLDFAGLSVAMGNAGEQVRQHADFVTLDVDEGGLLYALHRLL